jgi:putative FmdB family regulatory protein
MVYEYKCKDCGKEFELIHVSEPKYKVKCIECDSENVEKLVSKSTFKINGYKTPKFHR